jgi:hypothetical protein
LAWAAGLFRGSELPRLLVLLAIVLVGWPLLWLNLRPAAPSVAPPVAIAAVKPLPPPDNSAAFAAIQDKTTLNFRENAAYSTLLTRVRETPAAQLAAQSRRDVPYTELWERPQRYRGVPIHLVGTARRSLVHDELNPELAPSGKLYETYVYTYESQNNPYVLVFEEPPPGFPGGLDITERVAFDGYFFKLLAYQAGDRLRAAPVLVGRLYWKPPQTEDAGDPTRRTLRWAVGGLSLLTFYALLRWVFHFRRRRTAPATRRPTIAAASEMIEPEVLSQWLEQTENGGGGDESSEDAHRDA